MQNQEYYAYMHKALCWQSMEGLTVTTIGNALCVNVLSQNLCMTLPIHILSKVLLLLLLGARCVCAELTCVDRFPPENILRFTRNNLYIL